jgi:hypothetical protein
MNLLFRNITNTLKIACFLLIFPTGLNAQNLILKDVGGNVVTGDTIDVVFLPGPDHGWTELTVEVFLKNISNDTLEAGLKKKEFTRKFDEYHSFCFAGNCVDSSTHTSPYHAMIVPGGVDSSFSGHFRFDDLLHVPNKCLVSYTFYNVNNPADSAIVYVSYNTMLQSGVSDYSSNNAFLSNAFPNPVNDFLNFNYNLLNTISSKQAYLVISNTLGQCQRKQLLTEDIGSISINTSDWKPGVYYYSILSGNVRLAYHKCIIIH